MSASNSNSKSNNNIITASSSSSWYTLESDPAIFTSLLASFDCPSLEVTEVYSLDTVSLDAFIDDVRCVYGLIFLFQWNGNNTKTTTEFTTLTTNTPTPMDTTHTNQHQPKTLKFTGRDPLTEQYTPSNIYFARQMTANNCATQALLSIVFNIPKTILLGDKLTNFQNLTQDFTPQVKGDAIANSQELRSIHNSYVSSNNVLFQDDISKQRKNCKKEEAFHFIAFVPFEGRVYELDGLKEGPVDLGEYRNSDTIIEKGEDKEDKYNNNNTKKWLKIAISAIQQHIQQYPSHEIKFNLMALIKDKRIILQDKVNALIAQGHETKEIITPKQEELMTKYQMQLEMEYEKRDQWKKEQERRRHNYVPLIIEVLKGMAEVGTLKQHIST